MIRWSFSCSSPGEICTIAGRLETWLRAFCIGSTIIANYLSIDDKAGKTFNGNTNTHMGRVSTLVPSSIVRHCNNFAIGWTCVLWLLHCGPSFNNFCVDVHWKICSWNCCVPNFRWAFLVYLMMNWKQAAYDTENVDNLAWVMPASLQVRTVHWLMLKRLSFLVNVQDDQTMSSHTLQNTSHFTASLCREDNVKPKLWVRHEGPTKKFKRDSKSLNK